MTIYLDMRAGSAELLSHIQPRPSPMQLDSGDFMFVGNGPKGNVLVGGEVKKLGDALQCMQDGRLVTQLRKMLEDYDVLYFVLEARIRQNPKNGYLQQHLRRKNPKSKTGRMHEFWADAMFGAREHVMYEAFMSWLHLSIGFSVGVQVVHTGSNAETGAWISAQHRWYQKEWSEHKSLRVFDTSQRPSLAEPSRAAEVAHALADGIGWEKAAAAGMHFKTPRAVVNASREQWLKVKGIGKELAARAVEGADEEKRKRRH